MLGVVLSQIFQNYIYGQQIKVFTDHTALPWILKEKRANKSYNSRVTSVGLMNFSVSIFI